MCPVPNVTAAAQLLTVLAGAEMGTCVMLTCHVDVSCCMQRPTASSTPTDTSQDDVSVSEVTEVQAAVDLVQKQMRIYDGSFLQFRCDEKGFLSICAFGLPGKTHEDSPARAIQVHNLPVRPGLMPGPKPCFRWTMCCTWALYSAHIVCKEEPILQQHSMVMANLRSLATHGALVYSPAVPH